MAKATMLSIKTTDDRLTILIKKAANVVMKLDKNREERMALIKRYRKILKQLQKKKTLN